MAESAFEVINLAVSKYDIKELQETILKIFQFTLARKDIPLVTQYLSILFFCN